MNQRFESNRHYLAVEMQALRMRLEAFVSARMEGIGGARFEAHCREQLDARRWIRVRREEALQAGISIPFHSLSQRFELSDEEELLILCLLASHLSARLWRELLALQDAPSRQTLSWGFLVELLNPTEDLMDVDGWCSSHQRLLRNGLLVIDESAFGQARMSAAVQVPQYLADWALARYPVERRLRHACELREPCVRLFDLVFDQGTQARVDALLSNVLGRGAVTQAQVDVLRVLIWGPRGSGKTSFVRAFGELLGKPVFLVHAGILVNATDAARDLRCALRNAELCEAVLLVVAAARLFEASLLRDEALSLFESYRGPVFFELRELSTCPSSLRELVSQVLPLSVLPAPEREQVWETALAELGEVPVPEEIREVARAFELTAGEIERAASLAHGRAKLRRNHTELGREDLRSGAKSQLHGGMGTLSYRSSARVLGLDDLILPEPTMKQVVELLDACRTRSQLLNDWGFARRLVTGRGIVALFVGEPGTGKTLCAEILGQLLESPLLIVSVPDIMSKWVGETEKNIQSLFAQAQSERAVLVFDEADSLFTKRVKVERSTDHFQNVSVNLLLTEIERYEGVILLTTNLEANLDHAVGRRILFKLEFPQPGVPERVALWRLHIPAEVPLGDEVDFARLGECFELSGGQIKNAVLRAAYRALAQGRSLFSDDLFEAAQDESRSAGRLASARPLEH
ncbi:MAG: ATP-binding protein [Myxococcota bacterium]|nr:ATP-binding protein [Myxococcota bacterium]